MERFFSVDVETANSSMASICQIGLVGFENGNEFLARSWLVNPNDWFCPINVDIHGINEVDVIHAPEFHVVYHELAELVVGEILVSHTHFDRAALFQASARSRRDFPNCQWLDSAKVARRAWEKFAQSGYGLANLALHFGIEFKHHDALEDARVAGQIVLKAMQETGISLQDWLAKTGRPIKGYESVRRVGDGTGALAGESVVFTGQLVIPRREAADRAAYAGADVQTVVNKRTTVLIVGDQDISKLAGKAKSSKHLKAEQLIVDGQEIRIIGETDFLALSAITG